MFCTNCGEEMRATDKFCANCGSPAAPRPVRPRAVAPAAAEPPGSPSGVEASRTPQPAASMNVGNVSQRELGFSTAGRQAAPVPPLNQPAATPAQPAGGEQRAHSRQQEQQVLLEAEEIASVRGIAPIEALPPEFPPLVPAEPRREAKTQTCASCGEPNPIGNRFCERCGRSLQTDAAVDSAAAPPQAPTGRSTWLDVPEPARKPVAVPVRAPMPSQAATAPAPPAVEAKPKDDNFFYFYDDSSAHRSNRKLLIVLMVVLALGVLGVIYLMSRPGAKSAAGANVTVTISPTEAQVPAGEAHDFSATVSGSGDTDVIWSVAEGSAGGKVVNRGAQAQGGAVASMGVYIAPTSPGTYHVVAASKADMSKSATAEVVVSGK